MTYMAKVEAICVTNRGRFAHLKLEELPKGYFMRAFHVPSETLELGNRVKLSVELHIAKPKVESTDATPIEMGVAAVAASDNAVGQF